MLFTKGFISGFAMTRSQVSTISQSLTPLATQPAMISVDGSESKHLMNPPQVLAASATTVRRRLISGLVFSASSCKPSSDGVWGWVWFSGVEDEGVSSPPWGGKGGEYRSFCTENRTEWDDFTVRKPARIKGFGDFWFFVLGHPSRILVTA